MKQILSILTVIFAVTLLSGKCAQAQDDWTLKNPATKPSKRDYLAMAFLGDDKVLLFGGYNGDYGDDTWVYDLSDNTWTLKNPATKPPGRYFHAMASLGDDQVLLFGGSTGDYDDDTWVYDLSDNTWTLKNPATKPAKRGYHAMAFLGDDKALLFGGYNGDYGDDTWVYDLSDNIWTLKSPATKPPGRYYHAMASLGDDQALLFGGYTGEYDDDTWVYDLSDNTWTLKSPATKPAKRGYHAMASLRGDQVLLFGGYNGDFGDDTWAYDLSNDTWTMKSPAAKPPGRYYHAMASLGHDQALLFGGYSGDFDDDTWVYQGAIPCTDITSMIGRCFGGGERKTIQVHVNLLNSTIHAGEEITIAIDENQFTSTIITNGTHSRANFSVPGWSVGDHAVSLVDPPGCLADKHANCVAGDGIAKADPYWDDDAEWMATAQEVPQATKLLGNYPNPFNPSTTFRYGLREPGQVTLSVYDMLGQLVKTIVSDYQSVGYHEAVWDGKNESGAGVASGVYVYKITAGSFTATKSMLMLK